MEIRLPLLLLAFALARPAEAASPASDFPLAAGTFWVYAADLEFTLRGASPPAPPVVRKKHLSYEIRVLGHLGGGAYEAALLDGYPSDLNWYQEGQPRAGCIVVRTGTNNYFRLTGKVDELWKKWQANGFGNDHEELTADALILQAPLAVGMHFGEFSKTAGERYCWVVEGTSVAPKIEGVPAAIDLAYRLVFRTSPDHTFVDFLPGVGITRYEYAHHGTVANATLRLVRFGRDQTVDHGGATPPSP